MNRTLVVSQPMFLPWIGLFEQIRLADVFVHYDDVQLPQGRSLISRVQIKTANGIHWLTVPIDRAKSGKLIKDVITFDEQDWRSKHLKSIRHAYGHASHFQSMFALSERLYSYPSARLADFNIAATEQIAALLGLTPQFMRSSSLAVDGASTQRLVNLCEATDCDVYVTGHGALNYLDHEQFERRRISVRYMDYQKVTYPQLHGSFTPYVSILDAIANCGDRTRDLLCSEAVYWRSFDVNRRQAV
jgi:hypothetical protein